jgi:hypothetical protein
MTKSTALFLTNIKYINPDSPEGGVKLCTLEYITLIETKFNIIYFPVDLDISFLYRLKNRLKMNAYNDYSVDHYEAALKKTISENRIGFVFLNLSNTLPFAKIIKDLFPSIRVILCSHGNESGDFLHEIALHKKLGGIKRALALFTLGKMLVLESTFRVYLDLVLTVSDIEANIEKWLGANNVYMVARVINGIPVKGKAIIGKIGFFGDLTHAPNFYGVDQLCEALDKANPKNIKLILVGTGEKNAMQIAKKYSFVSYLGYLNELEFSTEASTWTFCINPVFYYSRGVSTKLGKALGMEIPVITTTKGMRGYRWSEGEILQCDTAKEMATIIFKNANNLESHFYYKREILKIKNSSPDQNQMMSEICDLPIMRI